MAKHLKVFLPNWSAILGGKSWATALTSIVLQVTQALILRLSFYAKPPGQEKK